MYNSVALSVNTYVVQPHHYLFPELFYHPKLFSKIFPSPTPPSYSGLNPGNHYSAVSMNLTIVIYLIWASEGALAAKNPPANARDAGRRRGFNPWVRNFPWRRAWQLTPVFLPGESPWREELGGLQSVGSQRVTHDWRIPAAAADI